MKLCTSRNFEHTVSVLVDLAYYNYYKAYSIARDLFKQCRVENRTVDELLVEIVNKRREEFGEKPF